ncbi:MAG TPA: hypothetical protein PKZ02_02175 [Candidatus Paceibacterota bacterium]|nr:hypothetical protein [Candidatus Paceibacterota bacterium]
MVKSDPGLHKDLVTGIVQWVIFRNSIPSGSDGRKYESAAMKKGIENTKASLHLFDLLLEGRYPPPDVCVKVLAGDYSNIWHFANTYFRDGFGIDVVEPVPIIPSDTRYETVANERIKK